MDGLMDAPGDLVVQDLESLEGAVEIELGSACLDRLTSAVLGLRTVLAPRDVLVLACDAPGQ
jgi:hypothetical protein